MTRRTHIARLDDERSEARERALSLLYEAEAKGMGAGAVVDGLPVAPDALAELLVRGVETEQGRIDELITRYAKGWTLARSVGTLLSGLHALPVPLEFQDDEHWIEYAGPDDDALKDQLRGRHRLPSSLLHLDYQPFNILADETGVTGVIDWSKACAGGNWIWQCRNDFARNCQ